MVNAVRACRCHPWFFFFILQTDTSCQWATHCGWQRGELCSNCCQRRREKTSYYQGIVAIRTAKMGGVLVPR